MIKNIEFNDSRILVKKIFEYIKLAVISSGDSVYSDKKLQLLWRNMIRPSCR